MNFKMMLSHEFGTPVTRLSRTPSVRKTPRDVYKVLALKPHATVTMIEIFYIPPNPRRL